MTVINIRGTNGSGKTTVVRHFMEELRRLGGVEEIVQEPIVDSDGKTKTKILAHKFSDVQGLRKPVYFMGRYNIVCGGADTLSWKGAQDVMEKFMYDRLPGAHFLFEGSIVSLTRRYLRSAQDLRARGLAEYWFGEMATPLDECIQRVLGRRDARMKAKAEKSGGPVEEAKDFDPKLLTQKWNTVQVISQETRVAGFQCARLESVPEVGSYLVGVLLTDERLRP